MSIPTPLQIPPQKQQFSNRLTQDGLERIYQALVIAKEEEMALVKLWLLWDLELLAYQNKDLVRLQIVRDEMERLAEIQRENEILDKEILELQRENEILDKEILEIQRQNRELDELIISTQNFKIRQEQARQRLDNFYNSVMHRLNLQA